MKKELSVVLLMSVSFVSMSALAGGESAAISACKNSIRDNYSVSNFRNVSADKIGHHRFRVYGKVHQRGHRYPFNCSVKRGWVQSYHYDGPYGGWDDNHKDKNRHSSSDKNVAIGVGLAALAVAAIVASSNSKKGNGDDITYASHVDKSFLEDECGESLGGRIRREHHEVNRLEIDHSEAKHSGRTLTGEGLIHWDDGQPSDVDFMCSFDGNGRVIDSSYSFY